MNEQMQDRALECQAFGTPEVGEGLKTILLTPDGAVESANGRFVVDAEGAAMMVESFDRQGVEIPVDFEHQTLGGPYSAPDGRAPAAGWVTKIWYEIGRGVSAFVRWNAKTREAIREGAYGYVSPVLLVRKSDLKAIGLHSVGLTNKPAIVGLARIAASTRLTDTERKPMTDGTMMDASAMLGELAGLLDIKVEGDGAALLAAIHDRIKALVAASASEEIAASVRTALGLPANANKDAVALALSVRSSGGAASAELAAMREAESQRVATEMVQGYIRTQQLNPNDKPAVAAARRLAMSDPGTLEAIFRNLPPLIPTGRTTPPTSRQLEICKAEREYRDNAGHRNATSLKAFVAQALRDRGLAALTENESVTLSV
jgi:phage I-like protein